MSSTRPGLFGAIVAYRGPEINWTDLWKFSALGFYRLGKCGILIKNHCAEEMAA